MTSKAMMLDDADERQARRTTLRLVSRLDQERTSAAASRLRAVVDALDGDPAGDLEALLNSLVRLLEEGDSDVATERIWLARSVLAGRLLTIDDLTQVTMEARLAGPWSVVLPALQELATADTLPPVRVALGEITCDIHSTAGTDFLSGIQRVVRNVAVRWREQHPEVTFVGWTSDTEALCDLSARDFRRVFGDEEAAVRGGDRRQAVIVPWRGIHLIPELPAQAARISRIASLGRYSRCRVGIIGYDVIPLTMAGSVPLGLVAGFARHLASCREVDRIAAISTSAAVEYAGWRGMLAGVAEKGPRVDAVPLPVTAQEPTPEALARASITLGVTSAPMFMVVGSHEPRKNHLAILHAAELLWRDGHRFTLTMVGAGVWRDEGFGQRVAELKAAGRPILTGRGLPDDQMWAGLKLARCTIFPSLNEGFGLPVAESLAAGTPVITSNFGSTRDIVAPFGAALGGLLVDPRSDHELRDAMHTMLTDEVTYRRLKAETAQHRLGTWDDYARDVWSSLVEGSD